MTRTHFPLPPRGLTLLLLFAATQWLTLAEVRGDAQTYRRTLQSTTWVLSKNSEGTSSGTGVLIDAEKRLVITNAHVVGDSRNAVIFFPAMKQGSPIVERSHYLENVRKIGIRGRIIAVDRKRDLALVELDKIPEGAEALPMVETSVSPGEIVESIGNPGSTDALWVYTSGTVRSVYQKQFRTGGGEHDFRVVETQSPINSGDSGGPVVNSKGELVAISQAIAPKARLVSYCVDVSEIKEFLESPWKKAPLPVTEILDEAELKYSKDASGHYKISLPIDVDDSDEQVNHEVLITKDVEYYERADVRKVWSLAHIQDEAPSQETTIRLLQQSARTKLGGWTVEKTGDDRFVIVYVAKIDATATPAAVKSTMEYVAKLTRSMNKELNPAVKTQDASDTLRDWLAD